jgi:hypothetical protein
MLLSIEKLLKMGLVESMEHNHSPQTAADLCKYLALKHRLFRL